MDGQHFIQDECARFLGLAESDAHDFGSDPLDLDVHLQGSDPVFGTGYFEVHVTQVIFSALDVGQYNNCRLP